METIAPVCSSERIIVTGVVQGVGFRPFVYRLASELGLAGRVGNNATEVFVEVSGPPADLDQFEKRLRSEAPPLARVDAIRRTSVDGLPPGIRSGFNIVESVMSSGARTLIPPDTAVCGECLAEMRNPADRRFGHPFITCTNCGPRFTIIQSLPYDRPATTMAGFEMCPPCRGEYADPGDRRYHAQPIGCHDCGPRLSFTGPDEADISDSPLSAAGRLLQSGGIVAIKGLGGFHLACDATNAEAVERLRLRKQRPDKPLAVMVPDIATARKLAHIAEDEAAELSSPARPIVLLRSKAMTNLAPAVAPGNPLLGLMLPYTPVHHLLFERGIAPLVMTSGNLHGEPIVYRDGDLPRLHHFVDGVLTHDRPIEFPCDDSVIRVVEGRILPLRRARGYAPLPVTMPHATVDVLAVGGELKNTFTLVDGGRAWISPHVGDMENLETVRASEASSDGLRSFLDATPDVVAMDAHPGYASSRWARANSGTASILKVQHHWAHVAAVMAEHHLAPETRILGIAFDGTGYGTDEAIWGGEILAVDGFGFSRIGHLAPVQLPGGDAAVRFPSRMALAYLHTAGIDWSEDIASVRQLSANERHLLERQLERGLGCVPCTSMGRLFDAVASLLDIRHEISYEAQAAIELEILATESLGEARPYAFGTEGEMVDPAPVLRAIIEDLRDGFAVGPIAAGFHIAVAKMVASVAGRFAGDVDAIALTGGCFQNALLLRLCLDRLRPLGVEVLTHHIVPPNDGGLSLGQAYIAAHVRK